jgi:uncharacterized protein (TIGR03382 family)
MWHGDGEAFDAARSKDIALRGDGMPEETVLDLRGAWGGNVTALRVQADGPIALTRVGGATAEELPPPPAMPDAAPPAPDAAAPDAVPAPEDVDVGPDAAAPPDGSPLPPGPPSRYHREIARNAHYTGGCEAAPAGPAVPWLLALLPFLRRRRR